jgi:enoyl-CoA hydratase
VSTAEPQSPVVTSRDGHVLWIMINRPTVRNAIDRAAAVALAGALDVLDADDDLRIGIIYGAGATFCSGMDLKGFARGERPTIPGRGFGGLAEAPPNKPLIAAVEGYALAGGMELALAADLIIAASNAVFGIPEVKRGMVAAGGGVLRLGERIPYHVAMELALTGRSFQADEAYRWGLVNELTEPGKALDAARALAAEVAGNGPLAVRVSKAILRRARDWHSGEMFSRQRELTDPVFQSADAVEGARAFAEKREPRWTGK